VRNWNQRFSAGSRIQVEDRKTLFYRNCRREYHAVYGVDESPSSSAQTPESEGLGAPRAYIYSSTRRFPVASRRSTNWQLTRCLPHQISKPVERGPTENNQVTPSPVRDRSNGGVAPPRVRRTRNRNLPTNRPFGGRGRPAPSGAGGCHIDAPLRVRDCLGVSWISDSIFDDLPFCPMEDTADDRFIDVKFISKISE
jgi:hypothetical protein